MNAETVARLLSLNKQFYQTFGREFSSTRQRLQPGVLRILDTFTGEESLLDLGCGNGELARERVRRGQRGPYTGLDFSQSLLEVARHGWEDSPTTFIRADLSAPDWDKRLLSPVHQSFDRVTAFAVLHHIPGVDLRLTILRKIHDLLRPGGQFIHSEWQFLSSDRLKGRLQPWQEIGLTDPDVDHGDFLLDWRSGGRGLRYAHSFDEAELEKLAEASHFRVCSGFLSDGENGQLGLYQVWEAVLRRRKKSSPTGCRVILAPPSKTLASTSCWLILAIMFPCSPRCMERASAVKINRCPMPLQMGSRSSTSGWVRLMLPRSWTCSQPLNRKQRSSWANAEA
jgi:tRNA (uracil-5-)-methyltransferase TRM9